MPIRLPLLLALIAPLGAHAADIRVGALQPYTTLTDAITAADDGDRILVDPGTYAEDLAISNRTLSFESTGGSGATIIQSTGSGLGQVVEISTSEVAFTGFTFDGADETRPMYVYSSALVDLDDVMFVNGVNSDGWPGGALDIWANATVTVSNAVFDSSTAYVGLLGSGGHVAVELSSTFITTGDVTFLNGGATSGGAIYVDGSADAFISGARFQNNTAAGIGDNDGGAIHAAAGATISVESSTFLDNSVASDLSSWGGAIYSHDNALWVDDSVFAGNQGAYKGGAIAADGGVVTVRNSQFAYNNADYAGAVYCVDVAECSVLDSWFEENTARGGAALSYNNTGGDFSRNMFCHNSVPELYSGIFEGYGGAVSLVGSDVFGSNNVFFENAANEEGGAIAVFDSVAELWNNDLIGNTSPNGGAMHLSQLFAIQSNVTLGNNLFARNDGGDSAAVVLGLASVSVSHNYFYANYAANTNFPLPPTEILGGDPLLANDTPGDCTPTHLFPLAGSPLVDAGDPNTFDPDGTVADIGAFGGPNASPELWVDGDGDGIVYLYDCNDADASASDPWVWVRVDADDDGFGDYYDPGYLDCLGPGLSDNNLDCFDDDHNANAGPQWFPDADGDGFGGGADGGTNAMSACEAPSGYVDNNLDCDDGDASIGSYDGYYGDSDGDGYGDPNQPVQGCAAMPGAVLDGTDCDDSDPAVNPQSVWYVDADGDGIGDDASGTVSCLPPNMSDVLIGGDCDDQDPAIGGPSTRWPDADGDGYGDRDSDGALSGPAAGWVGNNNDCDDGDASLNPDTVWYYDNDLDGLGNPNGTTQCNPPSDGWIDVAGDCNDSDPAVGGPDTWFADSDGDGFGDAALTLLACNQPNGFSATDTDCDDGKYAVHPGANELCDQIDSDCDGELNDAESVDASTYYADADGDGHGDPATASSGCTPVNGEVLSSNDCDDTDPATYPGAPEVWYDGVDQNCDQSSDFDQDGDGFDAYQRTAGGDDCNDEDTAIHPDASEVIDDDIDQDCDGVVAATWLEGGMGSCSSVPRSALGLWWLAALFVRRRRIG